MWRLIAIDRSCSYSVNARQCHDNGSADAIKTLSAFFLASLIACCVTIPAFAETVRPMLDFSAEGVVSTKTYSADGTVARETQGAFLFVFGTNGWEIQITPKKATGTKLNPELLAKTVVNCKEIPGGIRYFVGRNDMNDPAALAADPQLGKSSVLATAEPISYPPPEMADLFACWLTLCPGPSLPVIDSNHIRRFLSAKLAQDPKNKGEFTRSYLPGGYDFLSKFAVTNDGVIFDMDNKPFVAEAPFNHGHCEMIYEVSVVTNYNKIQFPLQAALRRYLPLPTAQDLTGFVCVSCRASQC